MASCNIAIKIGSNSTIIYKQGEGIVLCEPTAIAVSGTGKNKIIKAVGQRAKRLLGRTDKGTQVLFPVFRGAIIDADMATALLKIFLSKIIEKSFKKPEIKAIVCVPIGLTDAECHAYEHLCLNAGINEVTLLPSALCGAVGLNLPVLSPHGNIVATCGSGNTDIAVIAGGAIVSGIGIGYGGNDIDNAIEDMIAEKYKLIVGNSASEKVKKDVASLYENDNCSTEISGIDNVTNQARTDVVSSGDVYQIMSEHFDKVIDVIKDTINTCPPEIVRDIQDSGLYLIGGGSKVTGIEKYFRKRLEMSIYVDEDSNFVEVIGAGKLLSDYKTLKELLFNL